MRWERPFLGLAAAHNAAWAAVVASAPERVFVVVPPKPGVVALLILAVGACFAVNVFRWTPFLLRLGLVSKLLGPAVFVLAVDRGYVRASSWPLVLVTDLAWIPPLVVMLRRPRPC